MNNKLTIFYDGNCPLCNLEMQKLKQCDTNELIILINLHQPGFSTQFPHINIENAMKMLHAEYQGKVLLALDVTHRAWTLVGRKTLAAPLQWPIIKQLAHCTYLILAKYRHPISNFLYQRFGVGSNVCIEGVCYDKSNNRHYRG
jgi:predicted DCC family thiol-disulfide oxidoreductase YuxK